MEKTNKKLDIVLALIPVFVYILLAQFLYREINYIKGNFKLWFQLNLYFSFFILCGTALLIILKKHKSNAFPVWIGFSIYFSLCFVTGRDNLSSILHVFNYLPIIRSDYASVNYLDFTPSLAVVIHVLLFLFIAILLKKNISFFFVLLSVYYFVYSNFVFEVYKGFSWIYDMRGIVIINSIALALFVVLYILSIKRNFFIQTLLFIQYLVSVHIIFLIFFKLKESFFWISREYLYFFLIESGVLYILLILFLVGVINSKIEIRKPNEKLKLIN